MVLSFYIYAYDSFLVNFSVCYVVRLNVYFFHLDIQLSHHHLLQNFSFLIELP